MTLENFRAVNLKIDRANGSFLSDQFAKAGDYNGRRLVVQLSNAGVVGDLTGVDVNLGWQHDSLKNTGLDPFEPVDLAQGIFEIYYPKEMLTNGNVTALIQIIEGGHITETKNFKIKVEKSVIDEDTIVSGNSFTVLQDALLTVNRYDSRIANVENSKVDKSTFEQSTNNLTAQLQQTEQSLSSQLAQTEHEVLRKRELEDLSPTVLSAIQGGEGTTFNLLSIPQDKSVGVYQTAGVDVIGFNLYRYPNHVVNGFFIDGTGTIVTGSTSAYAKVPIQSLTGYSMWKADGSYKTGDGLMIFQDGDGTTLSTLDMAPKYKGKYLDLNYITFETPANAKYVLFNVKLGTAFDSRQNVIVLEGSEISTEKLSNKEVTKLFGGYLTDLKSKSEIAKLKDSVVGVGGNIYNHETQYNPDYYVDVSGDIRYASNWGYAKVPLKSYEQISVWMPNGKYNADIGSIGFYQGDTMLTRAYLTTPSGQYNGVDYITLTVPEGADTVAITVKRPAVPIFDNSTSLIVTEGDSVSDYALEKRLLSVSGYEVETTNQSRLYEDVVWTALGDSLTEKNIRATTVYHEYVAEELGFKVNNMGKSGTGYKNTDTNNTAFYQRVLDIPLDTQVVTFFGSLNDFGSGAELGTASDSGTTTIAGAINTTIDNLYSILPTVPLGIISPTPWHTSDLKNENNSATKYARLLSEICRKRGIPFLDLYFSSGLRPWEADYRTLMYSKDPVGNGTHPDENGHKLIAPQFREFIKTLI